jgi:uncharacterized membrane protein YjjB (DUF3815 family)
MQLLIMQFSPVSCHFIHIVLYHNNSHLIFSGLSTGLAFASERVLLSESHMHPWKSIHTATFIWGVIRRRYGESVILQDMLHRLSAASVV